jgi:hypothetical protein
MLKSRLINWDKYSTFFSVNIMCFPNTNKYIFNIKKKREGSESNRFSLQVKICPNPHPPRFYYL